MRGLSESLRAGGSSLGLAGSLVFAVLLASACGSEGARNPGGPIPASNLVNVPLATATAQPEREPVQLASAAPEEPAAITTLDAPPPANTAVAARPALAPVPQTAAADLPALMSFNKRADDIDVLMTISPARVGPNEVNFFFYDTDGDDRSVQSLSARFSFLDFAGPATVVELSEAHPGHAYLLDYQFRHGGRWRIEFSIRRAGLRDATTTFELTIR